MAKHRNETTSVIVTVADEALKNIHQLAARLRDKGMTISRVLPLTGVISGTCDAAQIATIENQPGVTSVEKELVAELPPPDAEVQ